jgi:hypothetical protein
MWRDAPSEPTERLAGCDSKPQAQADISIQNRQFIATPILGSDRVSCRVRQPDDYLEGEGTLIANNFFTTTSFSASVPVAITFPSSMPRMAS